MAFTKALYYPWIDIENETWLKNAMLYWENIQTIVPNSIEQPYRTTTAQEFYEEGLLEPFYVESKMRDIDELTDDVLNYLDSPEGVEILMSIDTMKSANIHYEKLPNEIRELANIHPEKLPFRIKDMIDRDNNWINVDSRFADFYMTLLATRLSEKNGIGLLTDKISNNKLANVVRLDSKLSISRSQRSYENNRSIFPSSLSQGTLADLTLEKIQIASDTPVWKILEFRTEYENELGRFRTKIDELTNTISSNKPLEAINQQIEDIYINKVKPDINSLKEGLKDLKINYSFKDFFKISFFSASPLKILGMAVPHALFAGTGASLIATTVLYKRQKNKLLRDNPYSYVLLAETQLKKKSGLMDKFFRPSHE